MWWPPRRIRPGHVPADALGDPRSSIQRGARIIDRPAPAGRLLARTAWSFRDTKAVTRAIDPAPMAETEFLLRFEFLNEFALGLALLTGFFSFRQKYEADI